MTFRQLAAGFFLAALLGGCASAPQRRAEVGGPAPDPDRWARAACERGEYPDELDARALARARHDDLRARRNGDWSPFATARLMDEREAFDVRCSAWLSEERAVAKTSRVEVSANEGFGGATQ